MTLPIRPVRRVHRDRRFDLRTTALFFVLLAIILCVAAFLVRTAASAVERRPVWAGVLAVLGVATGLTSRRGWRRVSAARGARRAARALHEAAERASGSLVTEDPQPDRVEGPQGSVAEDPWVGYVEDPPVDYAALDPDGFECAVAGLCSRDGCAEVEVVGGAGDLGADVIATTADGRRVVIQCKQYGDTHKVGSQDMQRFGGTCFTIHGAEVAALVTTSGFTEPALAYARQCGIVCMDGDDLDAWCRGTGPSPWHLTAHGA